MFPWNNVFEQVDLAVESKDWDGALDLLDAMVQEASANLIDPSFLLRQLRDQQKQILNLAGSDFRRNANTLSL